MKRILLLCGAFFLSLVMLATAQVQTATLNTHDNGTERSFRFFIPTNLPAKPALVLCFHGSGGTSVQMEAISAFNALAEKHHFIVCYPQAMVIGSDVQWNVYVDDKPGHAGLNELGAVDDVVFSQDLVSYFKERYGVDTTKVFASGLSNGGFMCYMLAVSAASQFRSIAPVAANMWGDNAFLTQYFSGNSFRPVRVMHTHGTADKVVDYPDPTNDPNEYIYPLAGFSYRMCANTRYIVHALTAQVDQLNFCDAPDDVLLIRQKGAGHQWNIDGFDLSAAIVHFFGLDIASERTDEIVLEGLVLQPQPADQYVRITLPSNSQNTTLVLRDLLGAEHLRQFQTSNELVLTLENIQSGTYSIELLDQCGSLVRRNILCVRH